MVWFQFQWSTKTSFPEHVRQLQTNINTYTQTCQHYDTTNSKQLGLGLIASHNFGLCFHMRDDFDELVRIPKDKERAKSQMHQLKEAEKQLEVWRDPMANWVANESWHFGCWVIFGDPKISSFLVANMWDAKTLRKTATVEHNAIHFSRMNLFHRYFIQDVFQILWGKFSSEEASILLIRNLTWRYRMCT